MADTDPTEIELPDIGEDDDDWGDSPDGLLFDTPEYRAKLKSLKQVGPVTRAPTTMAGDNGCLDASPPQPHSQRVSKQSTLFATENWLQSLQQDPIAEKQDDDMRSRIITTPSGSDKIIPVKSPDFSFQGDKFSASLPSRDSIVSDGPHQFDRDYIALVPKDQIEVWLTKIEFLVPTNETCKKGYRRGCYLLSQLQ